MSLKIKLDYCYYIITGSKNVNIYIYIFAKACVVKNVYSYYKSRRGT